MEWITLDAATVTAHLPTDLAAQYQAWVTANPDKATRLAEITANTVAEVRDNIRSNPANTLDPDISKIPQSATRHAESIIFFQLSMEMGLDIAPEGTQSMTRADMFLRQISYNHFTTTGGAGAEGPSPHYTQPERLEGPRRALPLLAALLLAFAVPSCTPSYAGWIAVKRGADDAGVTVTYVPQHYTNSTTQLFGHLQGLDQRLGSLLPTLLGAYSARLAWDGGTNQLDAALGRQSLGLGDAARQGLGAFLPMTNASGFGGFNLPSAGEQPGGVGYTAVGSEPVRFRGRSAGGVPNGVDVFVAYYPLDPEGAYNLYLTNTSSHKHGIVLHTGLLDLIAGNGLGVRTNAQGIPQLVVTNAP